eukprot:gene22378-30626_t
MDERKLTYVYGETAIKDLNSGDTAWMLAATALVLLMTLPGLALFYSGMTRTKNVLSVFMQVFTIACLITFLWLCFGYSLAFGPALAKPYAKSSVIYGNASRFWLRGLHVNSYHQLAPTIPESVYCMYQLTFAIISPALITGSYADRIKFVPMLIFTTLWHFLVYCPIAHACWHPEGLLFQRGALDYAGGNPVHIASGVSGLVAAVILGPRKGFGKEVFEPHNVMFSLVGVCLLWVGWFGFNAGSATAANTRAGMAMLVTHISAAVASLAWLGLEWYLTGVPKLTAIGNGAVAGLVAITPASGYVDPTGAFFIGLVAGPMCLAGAKLKHYMGYDDALDSFGVHAVGGLVGGFLTGLFATDQVNPGYSGLFYTNVVDGGNQLLVQVYSMLFCLGWAGIVSFLILKGLDLTLGLRVDGDQEDLGLDSSYHGETLSTKEVPSAIEMTSLARENPLEEQQSLVIAP